MLCVCRQPCAVVLRDCPKTGLQRASRCLWPQNRRGLASLGTRPRRFRIVAWKRVTLHPSAVAVLRQRRKLRFKQTNDSPLPHGGRAECAVCHWSQSVRLVCHCATAGLSSSAAATAVPPVRFPGSHVRRVALRRFDLRPLVCLRPNRLSHTGGSPFETATFGGWPLEANLLGYCLPAKLTHTLVRLFHWSTGRIEGQPGCKRMASIQPGLWRGHRRRTWGARLFILQRHGSLVLQRILQRSRALVFLKSFRPDERINCHRARTHHCS